MTHYKKLFDKLEAIGQQHILKWWDELSHDQQVDLANQIQVTDFDSVVSVWNAVRQPADSNRADVNRGDIAQTPETVVLQPVSDADFLQRQEAQVVGAKLLADSKVAVITVAGGQGSRLGFEHPKGMFPIGPVSGATLFQLFAEQINALRQRHGGSIPWLIMTSAATHDETFQYFDSNQWFGLGRESVHLFQQGSLPAVDATTGKVLMKSKHAMCLSPDGHGGLVTALKSSGLLDKMTDAGVSEYFYHQVDNPTAIICDPVLLGLHVQQNSQLTTNVVRKVSPTERMGALATVDGALQIIEYSELTDVQANRKSDAGDFVFWAGNTAIHVFNADFLHELTSDGCQLELHLAHKKVAHLDTDANIVAPEEPNANKFERFIFDALPLAKSTLIVEGNREREFNPVKNATGNDSPQTSQAAISQIAHEWLSAAGVELPENAVAEIRPSISLDKQELIAKVASGEIDVERLYVIQ